MKKMSNNIHNFNNIKSVVPLNDEVYQYIIFRENHNEKDRLRYIVIIKKI